MIDTIAVNGNTQFAIYFARSYVAKLLVLTIYLKGVPSLWIFDLWFTILSWRYSTNNSVSDKVMTSTL